LRLMNGIDNDKHYEYLFYIYFKNKQTTIEIFSIIKIIYHLTII